MMRSLRSCRGSLKTTDVAIKVLSVLSFLGVWQVMASFRLIPIAVPSPFEVAVAFVSPHFTKYVIPATYNSLIHVAFGFSMALIVAIPLGMAMGWYGLLRRVIDPIIELFRPIPPIAWVAFALIIFVDYLHVSAFLIFVGAFFPLLTNTYHGFRRVSIEYIDVARSLGAGERDLLTKIALPSALPDTLTGVRVGLGVGWMCVIAAEMFGAPGLGWMIMQMEYLHDLAGIMAYMFTVGALGFSMERGFRYFETLVLRWQRGLIRG
jgi:NitT/TauT family transport system permease protein